MSENSSNNKRIAKNALVLYIRMLFTMAVSLYTSRVILKVLGVEDYGIYNIVGGVVELISFLNVALSLGTSRFITFELGNNDEQKLKKVFSTTLSVHIALSLFIFVIAETLGLWLLYNKLVIPPERMHAALWAFQLSILACVISVTQIPYNSMIIAQERMNVYAYVSILEVSLKLVIVYMLVVFGADKLILYASLILGVNLTIATVYRLYCIWNFKVCHYHFVWDKALIKSIAAFSQWSLLPNFGVAMIQQGGILVMNVFFSPAIIASRAIATQVNTIILNFVSNFRTAVNPQIVKSCAQNDTERMKSLVRLSAQFSYYLMLLIELPIILGATAVLKIWLGQIPAYSILFVQLTLVSTLVQMFDISMNIVFYSLGNMKKNSIVSTLACIWIIPVAYVAYRMGAPVEVLFYLDIIRAFIVSFIVKPWLLIEIAGYTKKEIFDIIFPCVKVTIVGAVIPVLLSFYMKESILTFVLLGAVSAFTVGISTFYIGLTKSQQLRVVVYAKNKFLNR
jgi:O-antigen/teichoic acid export membrane protein